MYVCHCDTQRETSLHVMLPVMCMAGKDPKKATPRGKRVRTVPDMVVTDNIPVAVIVAEKK